jgi:ubiquinone/menaquinone biosynthesis C-methylase UbiE
VAQADAQQLPLASSSVSAVAAVWVLHVVADPAAVIEEVARVLAQGGRFCVISAQGHHAAGDEIDAALDAISPGPVHHDDAGSLTRAAASVGLALVEQAVTATQTYQRSPAVEARRMEKRLASHTFAMDDRTFAREVQPKIDALRALPDPDRDRTRVVHHDLLVFDRP